jgi:hypothetical protein
MVDEDHVAQLPLRLDQYDIFLIWHCLDVSLGKVGEKSFWRNEAVQGISAVATNAFYLDAADY